MYTTAAMENNRGTKLTRKFTQTATRYLQFEQRTAAAGNTGPGSHPRKGFQGYAYN